MTLSSIVFDQAYMSRVGSMAWEEGYKTILEEGEDEEDKLNLNKRFGSLKNLPASWRLGRRKYCFIFG